MDTWGTSGLPIAERLVVFFRGELSLQWGVKLREGAEAEEGAPKGADQGGGKLSSSPVLAEEGTRDNSNEAYNPEER